MSRWLNVWFFIFLWIISYPMSIGEGPGMCISWDVVGRLVVVRGGCLLWLYIVRVGCMCCYFYCCYYYYYDCYPKHYHYPHHPLQLTTQPNVPPYPTTYRHPSQTLSPTPSSSTLALIIYPCPVSFLSTHMSIVWFWI